MEGISNFGNIHGDGISEELFQLLWSKDELNFSPSINIPDTVVFKFGHPVNWFFTDMAGKVRKKNKHKLVNAKIEEAFMKHVLGYDIVATFIHVTSKMETKDGTLASRPSTIEFIDRKGLSDFLYNRKEQDANGILQRFIEPKGCKNEQIRAIWSPKVCLLERAGNIHNLHDTRYGLNERCVTYEGPEYYFSSAPLRGPVLAGQIQAICEAIVAHVREVSFAQVQIARIVLQFKVDSRDKIWLLYSSSVRVHGQTTALLNLNDLAQASLDSSSAVMEPKKMLSTSTQDNGTISCPSLVNIDNVVLLSDKIHLNPVKSYDKFAVANRTSKYICCVSCGRESLENLRHSVSYKTIIKHFDHVLQISTVLRSGNYAGFAGEAMRWPPDKEIVDAAGGVGFGCLDMIYHDDKREFREAMRKTGTIVGTDLAIPPILRYVHPKLNGQNFVSCKKDPLFLLKTVNVCESCYLVYAEFATMLLRVGQDLAKLLLPSEGAQQQLNSIAESSFRTDTSLRPNSSQWKAMTAEARKKGNRSPKKGTEYVSQNHIRAKQEAIGLRSSSEVLRQPSLPAMISSPQGTVDYVRQYNGDDSLAQPSLAASTTESFTSVSNTSYMASLNDDMKNMIAERERNFFQEVSRNPQLRDQHPLMHMISAYQKMEMVNSSSGVFSNKESSHHESVFNTQRYGKQATDKFDSLECYKKEIPYCLSGKVILPSVVKKLRKEEVIKKRQEAQKRKQKVLLELNQTVGASLKGTRLGTTSDKVSPSGSPGKGSPKSSYPNSPGRNLSETEAASFMDVLNKYDSELM